MLVEPSDPERAEWPDATREYVEGLEQRLDFLEKKCRVVYYPTNGEYPIEHTMAAQKDQWDVIMEYADGRR